MMRAAPPAITAFITITPATRAMISSGASTRNLTLRSIPMEMKKKLVKMSRKGMMLAKAWWK